MLYNHRDITKNFFITAIDVTYVDNDDGGTLLTFGQHAYFDATYCYSLFCSISDNKQIIKDFKELILPKLDSISIADMESIKYNDQYNIWFDLTEEELMYWKLKYEN